MKRTLYLVSEYNHGNLAITMSYEDAIDFLIKDGWIPKNNEFFFKRKSCEEFNKHMENIDETIMIEKIVESDHNIFRLR